MEWLRKKNTSICIMSEKVYLKIMTFPAQKAVKRHFYYNKPPSEGGGGEKNFLTRLLSILYNSRYLKNKVSKNDR